MPITPAAAPARPSRAPSGVRVVVATLAVLVAVLTVFAWGKSVSAQAFPANYGWQFQDLDGPGVAGGSGRSSEPVRAEGSSTVIYNGIPHTFYRSGDLLRHAWAPVSGWNFETLDGAGGGNGRTTNAVGTGSSAVVFNGDLHVFYADTETGVLRHSWYSVGANQWFAESLDGPGVTGGFGRTSNQVGGETSTVLFGGTPHIFYTDLSVDDLRHAWWTGSRWQFETLDGSGGAGGRVVGDIAVGDSAVTVPGSNLALQVFYRDNSSQRLRQAAYNTSVASWQFQDLDGPGVTGGGGRQNVSTGLLPSAVVFGGRPNVFYGNDNFQLRQGFVNSAGTWLFATLQSPADCGGCKPGVEPAATLYNGLPAVAHHDIEFGRLLLTRWTGSTWVNEALDGPGVSGGAGRTSDTVGLSASIIQYGVQLTVQNVDTTEDRLRQAWFGPAPPVNQTVPTISGTAEVGETLTVDSNGTWSNAPVAFAYQWQRCPLVTLPLCTDIAGASSSTYDVTDADINSALTVRVRATNAFGFGDANAAPTSPVPWPAPVATSLDPTSGEDLGGTTVVITGDYFADVTDVTFAGASATFTVDSTTQITVTSPPGTAGPADVVVITNTGTSTPLEFTYTLTPPVNETVPEITGTVAVGETLTASDGTWTNSPTSYSYQWQRCDVPVGIGAQNGEPSCVDIAGATASTYDVTDDDIFSSLQVVVVATNAAGDSDPATSDQTVPVPLPAPTITSIVPDEGPTAGGETVTLTGTYFSPGPSPIVSVGGVGATGVVVVSATELTFTVPAGIPGGADVVVETFGGEAEVLAGYTYFDAPTITTIVPDKGPVAGGQSVTVTGTNFVNTGTLQTTVTVGGAAVTNLVVTSTTELSFDTPAGTAGAADVVVTTAGGEDTATDGYTYFDEPTIATVDPVEGPSDGGQSVTVTGTNFADGDTTATVGGAAVTNLVVVSDTELSFDTPAGTAGLADVEVTTPGGTATAVDAYTYFDAPTISTIIPIAGPEGGAQTVQVTGTNFRPGAGLTTVTLAGGPVVDLDVTSETQFTFVTPPGTPGAVDLVVTTIGGTATATGGYTYLAAPTVTTLAPDQGPLSGGQTVTITGTALDVTGLTVTVGGVAATSVTPVSATEATFVTPAGPAGPADVVVSTDGGSTTVTDGYTYFNPPFFLTRFPGEGPEAGGQLVTVLGGNFVPGATTVTVNGVPATNIVVSPLNEFVEFDTPAGTPGPAVIVVTTPGGSINANYTYLPGPTFSSLTPDEGPTTGGQTVTLTGTNLNVPGTAVTVGGNPATNLVVSATTISFTTPAGTAGLTDVVVTTLGGTVTATDGYEYFADPTIATIVPDEGPTTGGQSVTVTGSGFSLTNTTVTVGGDPVTNLVVTSATELSFDTPAGSAGAADVVVTAPGGTDTATDAYTYFEAPTIATISPSEGPEDGGQSVTVTGTNFVNTGTFQTEVTVGGAAVTNLVVTSDTELSFDTPAGTPGPADVVVTTAGGEATATDGYEYLPKPTITDIDPDEGPTTGGQTVTVTGTNFDIVDLAVTVGGDAGAALTVVSPTQFTFTTPAGVAGPADVEVSTLGGEALATDGYTYFEAPTIDTITPNQGPVAGGQSVTVTGTNFVNTGTFQTEVTVGGVTVSNLVVTSTTELSFDTPAGVAGATDVIVTTAGGEWIETDGYTYYDPPTIVTIVPDEGPSVGGQTVTITGTNFVDAGITQTTVTVDGVAGTDVTVDPSGTSLTFVTPAGNAGAVDVVVTTPGGPVTATDGYTYFDAPTITSVDPVEGPEDGGQTVTATGTNFVDSGTFGTLIDVDGTPATGVTVLSSTELTFVTPAGTPGVVDVDVTTAGGDDTLVDGYEYLPEPTIGSITPNEGAVGGGTAVTLTGTNLDITGLVVTIGGVEVTGLVVVSPTEITFLTPAGTDGFADVVVTSDGGEATAEDGFEYFDEPTILTIVPDEGPTTGLQSVTITGTNFSLTGTTVTFGGVGAASVNVTSDTQLTLTTPANSAGAVDVELTAPGGTATATDGYTYFAAPTIDTITPDEGPAVGGQSVTVTGTNFVNTGTFQTEVTVGGVTVSNLVVTSTTELSFDTPAGTAGAADVVVTTAGGSDTATDGYTYFNAPEILTISPDEGPLVGGQAVTITGLFFVDGATTVEVGGNPGTNVLVGLGGTSLTFDTPAGTAGAADVVVTTAGGSDTVTDGYLYRNVPTISTIVPNDGPTVGGQTVAITGTNFVVGGTTVSFGGASGTSVNVTSATTLTVVTPSGAPGLADVEVTTSGGSDTATDGYEYFSAPQYLAIFPTSGPEGGTNTVTVLGNNFVVGATTVTLGGTPATNVVVSPDGEFLTFTAPAGTPGLASVVVTTAGGTATGTDVYTYLAAPTVTSVSPDEGPAAGGNTVTITGTNFDVSQPTVAFGATPATIVTVLSPTSLSVVVPAGTGLVDVTVATNGGSTTATEAYLYLPAPVLIEVDPAVGPAAGGTSVTLTGENFTADASVTVGGNPVTNLVVVSPTEITFTTPAGTAGSAEVVVTTPGGSSGGVNFVYEPAPTITSIVPNAGPLAGGQTVTVTGTNLGVSGLSVTVGGSAGTSVTPVSATQFTFVTPAGGAGAVDVVVTTNGGSATATGGYTYIGAPFIEVVDPERGPAAGGQTVTIEGGNFVAGATTVTFGGEPGTSVNVLSSTDLTVVTPANEPGLVDVVVTAPGGTDTETDGYTYVPPPTIGTITPDEGPTAGGTLVTLTGTNLSASGLSVTVGGNPVSLVDVSATEITFTTPAGVAGAADVVVTTAGGSDTATDGFTYLAAPTLVTFFPTSGPGTGGQTVNVIGSGFVSGGTTVTLGGNPVTNLVVSPFGETLSFTTPAGAAGPADLVITTAGGTVSSIGGYTYFAAPTITSIVPDEGPTAGGQTVTVTGTNFDVSTPTITVGGAPGTSVAVASPTQLTFVTPAGAAGAADVAVTTLGGTVTETDGYTYLGAPTIGTIVPDEGPLAGGTSVTVTGTSFSVDNTTVTVGGQPVTNLVVVSSTELTFDTPAGAEGGADVVVTTPGGTDTGTDGFTYFAVPTIDTISPDEGPEAGGQTVTITGTNFSLVEDATTVTFGGVEGTDVDVTSSTSLTVVTPAFSAVPVDVEVTSSGGASAPAVLAYTYLPAPTVTDIDPAEGPTAGGTLVTLTGTNFDVTGLSVTFGGTPAASVVFSSPTELLVETPAGSDGFADVVVSTDGGSDTVTDGFEYFGAPTIDTIDPDLGPEAGGQTVTITGTNFSSDSTVEFGGIPASVTFVSDTELSVVTPVGIGTVAVEVFSTGGSVLEGSGYTYVAAPTVDPVTTPAEGPEAGGETVTVTGTGFIDGVTTVTFDGVPGTSVNVTSSTSLTVVTPAGTPGPVDVAVTTPGGTGTAPGGYTYLAAPTISTIVPDEGSTLGGTVVTLTGTNLDVTGLTVTVGGNPANVFPVSATEISFETPAGTVGPADVVVSTDGGSDTATDGFTYVEPPTISTIVPDEGPEAGGQTVTITGTNFVDGATTVTFDGVPGTSVTVTSPTTLTVVTPAGTGDVDVEVETAGGTASAVSGYVYRLAPTIDSITPNQGPEAGGGTVTITGANFVPSSTTVTVGGVPATNVSVALGGASLTFEVPAGSAGAVDVVVTTAGGSDTETDGYEYFGAVEIISINPTEGPAAGGQTATVTGSGFADGVTSVTIGGVPAVVTFVSSTELSIVTGASSTGLKDVVVSTPGGSDTLTNGYRYRAAPTISEVAPTDGPVAGGEGIAVIGSNFVNGATTIVVAGVDVTATAQFTGSIVIGVVEPPAPGGVAGPVEVSVSTTGGTAYGTYTYTAAGVPVNTVAPAVSGTAQVGSTLTTDDGTWTNSPTSYGYQWLRCDVNGNACVEIGGATSSTYVVQAADEGATLRARVTATNASGSGQFPSAQTAVVAPAPAFSVTSVTPDPAAPGQTMTITGTGLLDATEVLFDGVPATSFTAIDDTTIEAELPSLGEGVFDVDVTVETATDSVTLFDAFTYAGPV